MEKTRNGPHNGIKLLAFIIAAYFCINKKSNNIEMLGKKPLQDYVSGKEGSKNPDLSTIFMLANPKIAEIRPISDPSCLNILIWGPS